MRLSSELAAQFTQIALGHVEREYPNALQHIMADAEDRATSPRALHPIFYGSYDWHSCVHGYWTIARCLRRFPDRPECAAVRALFDRAFTADKVRGEIAYFERPAAQSFERPYGWAWLLKLQAELLALDAPKWADALQPFADFIAARLEAFLPNAAYPIRAGTHANTAFALALTLDYADAANNASLREAASAKLRAWHGADRDAHAWEPSLDDFLSPTLMIAEAMRRALPAHDYTDWLAAFLPRLEARQPSALFIPAQPTLRSDGKIAHLDGLNLSRAWCWRGIAHASGSAVALIAHEAADLHLREAMPHLNAHYMGAHWLQSFALLALEA